MSNINTALKNKIVDISYSVDNSNKTISYVEDLLTRFNLDSDKYCNEILRVINTQDKINNVYAFVSKVAYRVAMESGDKYKKDWKKPNFLSLHLALNENDFTGELWEKLYIDNIETHALNEFVSVDYMCEVNRLVIDLCVKNNKKTYKDFVTYLLKAKQFKNLNIPLVNLEEQSKKDATEALKVIEDVENG